MLLSLDSLLLLFLLSLSRVRSSSLTFLSFHFPLSLCFQLPACCFTTAPFEPSSFVCHPSSPFPNLKLHFSPTALPVAPLLPTPVAVSPITSLLPLSISISSLVLSEASQLISDLSHNWSPDYIKKTKSAPHYCSVVELSLSRISFYSGESPVSFIPPPWETH